MVAGLTGRRRSLASLLMQKHAADGQVCGINQPMSVLPGAACWHRAVVWPLAGVALATVTGHMSWARS